MSRRVPNGDPEPVAINGNVAHVARIYDYLLGGSDNFAIDRETAEYVCAALPGGIEDARRNTRANRAFLVEAVRYLAGEVGVRQFLDIGTGIPNADKVHALAQETAPDARIVYVDYDPVVLAHAHELLRSTAEGITAYIHADLREPKAILEHAAATLDFSEPVAVMLVGILHYVVGDEDPFGIVGQLLDAVPSGSYLAVSHLASDVQAGEMAELAKRHNQPRTAETVVPRRRAEVARFLEGLDVVEPGLVRLDQWPQPGRPPAPRAEAPEIPIYAAIGRKP